MHRARLLMATAAILAAVALVSTTPSHARASAPSRQTGGATLLAGDGPIGHQGRWLTDRLGRVVMLHGVNLVAKGTQSPAQRGFDADDVAWLAENDFDVVRLGLVAADVMPTPGVIDTAYLDSFQSTVDQLTAAGILVLVDLHQDGWGPTLGDDGFPGWMTITNGAPDTHTTFPTYYLTNPAIQAAFDSFWTDATGPGGVPLQDRVATMFGALADRFATNPGVLGYDLINEPWPGSTYSDCVALAGGCPTLDHDRLDPYYARMDTAIRAAGDHHLTFAEPWVLFNFGQSQTNVGLPGGDADSGMAFHSYTVDVSREPDVLSNAEAWSGGTGGALLESEFGATQDQSAIDRQVDENDGELVPWIWWSYDGELVPDLTVAPGGTNLSQPVADALIRPHPVLVAGTPTSLDYDESTRTMTVHPVDHRAGRHSAGVGRPHRGRGARSALSRWVACSGQRRDHHLGAQREPPDRGARRGRHYRVDHRGARCRTGEHHDVHDRRSHLDRRGRGSSTTSSAPLGVVAEPVAVPVAGEPAFTG